jgi:transcriptional regulator with XRE-family HTH domain
VTEEKFIEFSGARLKALLRAQPMTQRTLALRVGKDYLTVWRWCKGQTTPGANDVYAICSVLGCTPDALAE